MPRPATTWRISSTSRAASGRTIAASSSPTMPAAPMRWARILAALHQRHVTGKGQMVDVSMFESLVGMLLGEVNRAQFDFEMPSRPMYGPIEAKDGYVMLATASERTFQDMATAAGRRDWLTDPRFEKYADRRMNWGLFVDEFEEWSKTLTRQGVRRRPREARRALLALSHRTEALKDPQVAHRGSLCTIEDSAGSLQSPAPPFRFSGSALQSGPKVASLGEHTESVLAEAGLSQPRSRRCIGERIGEAHRRGRHRQCARMVRLCRLRLLRSGDRPDLLSARGPGGSAPVGLRHLRRRLRGSAAGRHAWSVISATAMAAARPSPSRWRRWRCRPA